MTECERIIEQGILPPEFFKPEVRNDFLVDETRKKLWAIEIDLLLELDRVCKKHGLKYFLFWGTLLGTVRHKGFVPWDDDLDVVMPRDDYDKIITLAGEFQHPYFLQTPFSDKNSFFSFTKLKNSNTSAIDRPFLFQNINLGIFIDISTFDNVLSISDYNKRFDEIYSLTMENATYMRMTNPYLTERDKKRVSEYKPGDPMERYRKINQIATTYRHEKTEHSAVIITSNYARERQYFYSQDLSSSVYMDFEGFNFPVPAGYDRILKTAYGDYMQLPPVQERGKWHSNIIFEPDVPYRDLLKKYQSYPWPK